MYKIQSQGKGWELRCFPTSLKHCRSNSSAIDTWIFHVSKLAYQLINIEIANYFCNDLLLDCRLTPTIETFQKWIKIEPAWKALEVNCLLPKVLIFSMLSFMFEWCNYSFCKWVKIADRWNILSLEFMLFKPTSEISVWIPRTWCWDWAGTQSKLSPLQELIGCPLASCPSHPGRRGKVHCWILVWTGLLLSLRDCFLHIVPISFLS